MAEVKTWNAEQLYARAAKIEELLEKWKGVQAYAETMRMEIWALRLAAGTLALVDNAIEEKIERVPEEERAEAWPVIRAEMCRSISRGDRSALTGVAS